MKYIDFNGESISKIALGTTGAGSRAITTSALIKQRLRSLDYGIDLGINFLDSCEVYEDGFAEELTGRLIKGKRNKIFLATKFSAENNSHDGVIHALEGSLKRLRTDYIDLYQLQWPNPNIPISETMAALKKLLDAGKIRYVGVSNLSVKALLEAEKFLDKEQILSNQVELSLFASPLKKNFISRMNSLNKLIIAYSVFGQGNLKLNDAQKKLLDELSLKYNRSHYQIIINYVASLSNVIALTRSMRLNHVKDNVESVDFSLDENDSNNLVNVFKRKIVKVSVNRIRVLNVDVDDTHPIYTTIEDAIENPLDLKPSPQDIACEVKQGNILKPIELVHSSDNSGQYNYDLIHGRMRYWGWRIAFGEESEISAYINS